MKGLIHDALPCKCSISMQEDGHHLRGRKPQWSSGTASRASPGKGPALLPRSFQHARKDKEQLINISNAFPGDGSGVSHGQHTTGQRLWPPVPPQQGQYTWGTLRTAKQHPVYPSWAASPIPKYTHPKAKPFSHWEKGEENSVPSHFQPRSPMGMSRPRSFRATDVILSPHQGLAEDTACQARTGSVYL